MTFLQKGFGSLAQKGNQAAGNNNGLLIPKDNALKAYLDTLQKETDAIGKNERALFIAKAEIEATSKVKEDFKNHVRSSADLLPEEQQKVEQLAGAFYDLKKAQEDNARIAKHMQDAIADSLAETAVNFNNLRDTATSAIQAIAKEIIKMKITQPLSKSIVDAMPSLNFASLLGFADGGSPPVGVPSIVGERGPEIFVPNSAGTVIPNHMLGGGQVIVQQTINLSPGLPETVNAAIRNAAPYIAAQAHASVMQAARKGGPESKILGLRSN